MAFPCFPNVAGVQPLALVVVFARNREPSSPYCQEMFSIVCSELFSIWLCFGFFSFKDKCCFTARKQTGYLRDYVQDPTQTQSRNFAICSLWGMVSICLTSLLGIKGTAFHYLKQKNKQKQTKTPNHQHLLNWEVSLQKSPFYLLTYNVPSFT